MSRREAFLDRAVGETRGVVLLDGQPERLIVARDTDAPALVAGARSVARVESVEAAIATAFLTLEGGAEAILPLRPDAPRPVRGGAVEIEIRAEARRGKLATAWLLGEAQGAPRLLEPAPDVEAELARLIKDGRIATGRAARVAADLAEAQALQTVHPLKGGGSIAIEQTRALTAIDVDTGARPGQDSKRVSRQANLEALSSAARLLRLKGIGGLIVFDLAGRGHDGTAMLNAARAAFNPDNPGVSLGPISRFGTLELTVPRRRAPVIERFLDQDGALLPEAAALRLARRLEDEGRADPGGRLTALCSPAAAAAFAALAPALTERLGARFEVQAREGWPDDRLEVSAR
ncbi:MAG: ribonuclease E/G [Caulobacter sp.]